MSQHTSQGWSRVPVQTTSISSEHNTHLKWRAFLFSLILFVFLEVAVVMYAGIGTSGHMSAIRDAGVQLHHDTAQHLRLNLGLDIENVTNGKHENTFLSGNSSMSYETFAEHYTELCEKYFIPRTIDAGKLFLGLFDQIAGRRMTSQNSSIVNNRLVGSPGVGYSNNSDSPRFVSRRDSSKTACPCVPDTLSE
jgi:hypothetical protein